MKKPKHLKKKGWTCPECKAYVEYYRSPDQRATVWFTEMSEMHKIVTPWCKSKELRFLVSKDELEPNAALRQGFPELKKVLGIFRKNSAFTKTPACKLPQLLN